MKKYLLTSLLIICAFAGFAATDLPRFKNHNLELSLSTDMDYYMFSNHSPLYKTLRKSARQVIFPFIGFNLGVNYNYRFTRLLGISAGLNNQLYADYYKQSYQSPYTGTVTTGDEKTYNYVGSVSFPIFIHLYVQDSKSEVAFITGPEFYLSFYHISRIVVNGTENGIPVNSIQNTGIVYSSTQVRDGAAMGWNFQVNATIFSRKSFSMLLGPEFKIINAIHFSKLNFPPDYSRFIDFSLGIKFGFRFGLKGKIKSTENSSSK